MYVNPTHKVRSNNNPLKRLWVTVYRVFSTTNIKVAILCSVVGPYAYEAVVHKINNSNLPKWLRVAKAIATVVGITTTEVYMTHSRIAVTVSEYGKKLLVVWVMVRARSLCPLLRKTRKCVLYDPRNHK